MALLKYRAPVKYGVQREIFQEFLQTFKTSEATNESAATEAIDNLRLGEDDLSDEELLDDDDGARNARRTREEPRLKYADILQKVADRKTDHIVIELDDLDSVSCCDCDCYTVSCIIADAGDCLVDTSPT